MSELIKLGGLWVNTDKNGKQYLAGRLSPTVRLLIFKNEYRSAENQPAYQMYLAPVDQPPADDAVRTGDRFADDFIVDDLPAAEAEPEAPRRPTPPPARSQAAPARPAPPAARSAAKPAAPIRRNTPEPATPDDLDDPFAD